MAPSGVSLSTAFSAAIERVEILHEEEVSRLRGEIATLRRKVAEQSLPPVVESGEVRTGLDSAGSAELAEAHVGLATSAEVRTGGQSHGKTSSSPTNVSPSPDLAKAVTMRSRSKSRVLLNASTAIEAGVYSPTALKIVAHPAFDVVIGLAIIANAVTIGMASSYDAAGEKLPRWLHTVEYCFLVLYISELALRVAASGRSTFRNNWVRIDVVLVVCSLVDAFLPTLLERSRVLGNALSHVMVIRLLRLIRIARLARLLVEFRTLWLLVEGLVNSMRSLIHIFVVLCIILYMFAVAALMVIRPDETLGERYNLIVSKHFSSLPVALLTLAQGVIVDSFASIYSPLIMDRPSVAVYFVAFVLVVSIALMNIVTALTVEQALSHTAAELEAKKAEEKALELELIAELREKFALLDEDGSGMLGLAEFQGATPELLEYVAHVAGSEEIEHVFRKLDVDSSNAVSIDEFCEGLLHYKRGSSMEAVCLKKMHAVLLREYRALQNHHCAPNSPSRPSTSDGSSSPAPPTHRSRGLAL